MKYDFNDCDDVIEIDLEVDLKVDLRTDLKVTDAYIFNEVTDEINDEIVSDVKAAFNVKVAFDIEVAFDVKIAFDVKAAFDINEANAIWMLTIIDRNSFDEAAFNDEASWIKNVLIFLMLNNKSLNEADDVNKTNLIW